MQGHTQSCGCLGESKGENKIKEILKANNIPFLSQKTFDTCIFPDSLRKAVFDFYLPELQTVIEYDGVQHFGYAMSGWNNKTSYNDNVRRDQYKNNWCKENHINLIRIPYYHYEDLVIEDLLPNSSSFCII